MPILRKRDLIPSSLLKFVILGIIHKLLEMKVSYEDIADFLKDLGYKVAELLYMEIIEELKPSKDVLEFVKNLKRAMKIFMGREPEKVSLILNTEERVVNVSMKIKCPLSDNFMSPSPLIKPGIFIAGILEKILKDKKSEFNAYDVSVQERLCRALGDDIDEFLIVLRLTPEAVKKLSKKVESNKWIYI